MEKMNLMRYVAFLSMDTGNLLFWHSFLNSLIFIHKYFQKDYPMSAAEEKTQEFTSPLQVSIMGFSLSILVDTN